MNAAPSVAFGFHLCRGNQASRWLAEGSYDPIAPMLFRKIKAQRLLLEYDDLRSGSFEPLRHVPDDKIVVLGLASTKTSRLETREELTERIREAARYVPLERLALSPQCGFASSIFGNRISPEDQKQNSGSLPRPLEVSGAEGPPLSHEKNGFSKPALRTTQRQP